jgi:hypothetical protein
MSRYAESRSIRIYYSWRACCDRLLDIIYDALANCIAVQNTRTRSGYHDARRFVVIMDARVRRI